MLAVQWHFVNEGSFPRLTSLAHNEVKSVYKLVDGAGKVLESSVGETGHSPPLSSTEGEWKMEGLFQSSSNTIICNSKMQWKNKINRPTRLKDIV